MADWMPISSSCAWCARPRTVEPSGLFVHSDHGVLLAWLCDDDHLMRWAGSRIPFPPPKPTRAMHLEAE